MFDWLFIYILFMLLLVLPIAKFLLSYGLPLLSLQETFAFQECSYLQTCRLG